MRIGCLLSFLLLVPGLVFATLPATETTDQTYCEDQGTRRDEESPSWEFFHPKGTSRLLISALKDVSDAELAFIGDRRLMHDFLAPRSTSLPLASLSVHGTIK